MLRSNLLSLGLGLGLFASAQQEALNTLTGGGSPQWHVIGNSATAAPKCGPGDATYTFKEAQVVLGTCVGGAWKNTTEPLSTWAANGKSGVAFGGAKYEVKTLPAGAPACKGNANCVRLTTVPDGKTDATRTLYLTH